jgi:hypothetical protein
MMDQLPMIALRTANVEALAATLAVIPGFQRRDVTPGASMAVVVDPDGDALLLVGPSVSDPRSYLRTPHMIFRPGQTLQFRSPDLDAVATALTTHGLAVGPIGETSWGDRELRVPGPDGYTLWFTQPRDRTPEEWIALYLRGPEAIEAAVMNMTEAELDLRPAPNEVSHDSDAEATWSIRQIVHHVADGDDLWAMPLKVALATPDARYSQDWYTPDNAWASLLDYAHRDIAPALALLRATRAHTAQLLRYIPGVWDRGVRFSGSGQIEPEPITAGEIVVMQARHALIHADSILAIRRAHGK